MWLKNKAFTLIELLVVVAIIGILAAVGVVAYNGYTKSAKIGAAKANLKNLSKYMQTELYKCDLGDEYIFLMNGVNPWFKCSWNQGQKASELAGTKLTGLIQKNFTNPYDTSETALHFGVGLCPNRQKAGRIFADRAINSNGEQYLKINLKLTDENGTCYTNKSIYLTSDVMIPDN